MQWHSKNNNIWYVVAARGLKVMIPWRQNIVANTIWTVTSKESIDVQHLQIWPKVPLHLPGEDTDIAGFPSEASPALMTSVQVILHTHSLPGHRFLPCATQQPTQTKPFQYLVMQRDRPKATEERKSYKRNFIRESVAGEPLPSYPIHLIQVSQCITFIFAPY